MLSYFWLNLFVVFILFLTPKCAKYPKKVKKKIYQPKLLLYSSSKSFTKRDFLKIEFWARYDRFHFLHYMGLLLSKQIIPKKRSGRALFSACSILLRDTGFLANCLDCRIEVALYSCRNLPTFCEIFSDKNKNTAELWKRHFDDATFTKMTCAKDD